MIFEYDCEVCGVHVRRRRSPSTVKTAPRFCSQQCNGIGRTGTGAGPTPNHSFVCEICGVECLVYRSPSAHGPRFCSVQCTGAAQRGSANPAYVNGRHVDKMGYMRVRVGGHYVLEHRLIMEQIIGRPLTRVEVVHHRNRDRLDNRIENLQLLANQAEHMAIHAQMRKHDRHSAVR